MDAEETRRYKARQLRYKKPIVKDLNLDSIKQELWDIQEECNNVHWYFEEDDETLINALDGDDDEAREFRMMFSDLCGECERMSEDLEVEWVPECFDRFFVAMGAGRDFGGILGFDSYEQDYFGLLCSDEVAESESRKTLKQMTKDDLIKAAGYCFRIYQSYIALRYRYDCLKAAMDILRDQNTAYLQMVKRIGELYEKAETETEGFRWKFGKRPALEEFDSFLWNLPQEAWIQ